MNIVSKEMLEAVARKGPASSRGQAHGQDARAGLVGDRILPGHRNTNLTSLAGSMRRRGCVEEAIRAALLVENREKCEPPLSEVEVRRIARSVARYEPGRPELWGQGRAGFGLDPASVVAEAGVLLSEVEAERVGWLWTGRIPRGKLSIIDGDPGTGKSAATTDLAARVSAGLTMPDGACCEAAGVVICSAEDGLADTIRPRLDAAGGDPVRVLALATVPDGDGAERMLSLAEDMHIIERAIERVGAALVIIDPLMAFLGGKTDSYRDQDMRRTLGPLSKLAEKTGAAIVVVRHLNKSGGKNPVYRGGGSIGIIGAARTGMLVAKDPDDEDRRVLSIVKSNLAAPAPSLAFTLEEADNGAVRVNWCGQSDLSAAELLGVSRADEHPSALEDAKEFLQELLAEGPVPKQGVEEAAEGAGISMRTAKRAKEELGVVSRREGETGRQGGGRWVWCLPEG